MSDAHNDWAEYIRRLPSGLDSYPTYQQKGSLVRSFCSSMPTSGLPLTLPPVLRDLIDHPPGVNTWIPEAHAQALYLAIYNTHFRSVDEYLARFKQINRELIGSSLYRGIFEVGSAQTMIRSLPTRWEALHRGIQLRAESKGDRGALIHVTAPSMLHSDLNVRGHVVAMEAAFEAAGAKNVRFHIAKLKAGTTVYEGSWD